MAARKTNATRPGRQSFGRRSRTRLDWFLCNLVVCWGLGVVALQSGSYKFRDPEFHAKLSRLETLLAQEPRRPLWLMLGSSKVADGLKPDLVARTPDAPNVFNFGHPGAKVPWQYLALRRLLDAGIRPEWLGIEIAGPTLSRSVELAWTDWPTTRALRYQELTLQQPFASNYAELRRTWWHAHLSPNLVGRQMIDALLDWDRDAFDRFGWRQKVRASVTPEDYAKLIEIRRQDYLPYWKDFAIGEEADRCLRALLDLCQARGIKTFLYEMPETAQFRAFYPPGARAQIEDYLGRITTEYRVPWVNAQDWVADSGYSDGLHLILPGAEQFSNRFREEVFQPFVRRWPIQPLPR